MLGSLTPNIFAFWSRPVSTVGKGPGGKKRGSAGRWIMGMGPAHNGPVRRRKLLPSINQRIRQVKSVLKMTKATEIGGARKLMEFGSEKLPFNEAPIDRSTSDRIALSISLRSLNGDAPGGV